MESIPTLPGIDSTLAFLRDGYTFASKRCKELGSDAFGTRLIGRRVTFMLGADASRTFWSGARFDRHNMALPPSATHLLQGPGSAETLEGDAHRHRKGMFLDVLDASQRERMRTVFVEEWNRAAAEWQARDSIVLHDALQLVLTRTAMTWAGLDLERDDWDSRAYEFAAMLENPGRFGLSNVIARVVRMRTDHWARGVIDEVRSGNREVPSDSVIARIATQANVDGQPLDRGDAAVELLNVLRPVVAITRFIVFAALCLHAVPRWQAAFASGQDDDLGNFVTEVRRHAPFFPVMGGNAQRSFEWSGHTFDAGDWVLLDLYGTNHDERLWPEPNRFLPERFRDWAGDPYTLIPQGGGDYLDDHRCPGEPATIDLMRTAVLALTRGIQYDLPSQDLRVSLRQFPAGPASEFRISGVRLGAEDWATALMPVSDSFP